VQVQGPPPPIPSFPRSTRNEGVGGFGPRSTSGHHHNDPRPTRSVSPPSPLHLPSISPPSPLHLPSISPPSPLHLPTVSLGLPDPSPSVPLHRDRPRPARGFGSTSRFHVNRSCLCGHRLSFTSRSVRLERLRRSRRSRRRSSAVNRSERPGGNDGPPRRPPTDTSHLRSVNREPTGVFHDALPRIAADGQF